MKATTIITAAGVLIAPILKVLPLGKDLGWASCYAQNVGISAAGTVPDNSAMLDVVSTTRGILIPRLTTVQRDAIISPATGLQIYNTDCKVVNYWSGTCWISMSKALPGPGPITSVPASTTFCAGQTRTYSITAVLGASPTGYTWTVPAGSSITSGQGTTSVNVTFGNISGNVCVDASNSCETSPVRCISVNVDPIPNTPGNITGPNTINPGQQSVTYFVASVNGASTYTWSYSGTGFSIASGTGTTTIVTNFTCTATSGTLSVTANSTCGASPASSLAITITPLLAANAGPDVFAGVAIGGSPTATGGTSPYTYSWLPASELSGYTVATPTALCTGATTTYTVTVTDSRSCTATDAVVVTRNLAVNAGVDKFGGATIGGTATGGAGSYAYAWTPANNLSSYTIATPTALCTGSTTTYTETVTDANGCTATDAVVVTRNLTASAGADLSMPTGCSKVIGGSPTASGGNNASYAYSWSPTTGLDDATLANPTSTVGSTTTYTVTVTDANGCTATDAMTLTVGSGLTATFNNTNTGTSGSIQNWTVPPGITCIVIETWGAQGGSGSSAGGLGARMKGTFTVTPGQVLKILVGQQGGTACSGTCDAGGGGGTFVTDNVNNPLIIAGGGGGSSNNGAGQNGTTATCGTQGSSGGGAGGCGGAGGAANWGASGGGLTGNGACSGWGGCAVSGGLSFTNGGTGGASQCGGLAVGGYGGGAGGHGNCCIGGGAGGGYSGGGAPTSCWMGGGGGSFNGGTSQSNTSGVKTGQGQVVITY